MSSVVSSTNVPNTPILVTTPTIDTKQTVNDHDESNDDQRHLSKQNSNKIYTRVRIFLHLSFLLNESQ